MRNYNEFVCCSTSFCIYDLACLRVRLGDELALYCAAHCTFTHANSHPQLHNVCMSRCLQSALAHAHTAATVHFTREWTRQLENVVLFINENKIPSNACAPSVVMCLVVRLEMYGIWFRISHLAILNKKATNEKTNERRTASQNNNHNETESHCKGFYLMSMRFEWNLQTRQHWNFKRQKMMVCSTFHLEANTSNTHPKQTNVVMRFVGNGNIYILTDLCTRSSQIDSAFHWGIYRFVVWLWALYANAKLTATNRCVCQFVDAFSMINWHKWCEMRSNCRKQSDHFQVIKFVFDSNKQIRMTKSQIGFRYH